MTIKLDSRKLLGFRLTRTFQQSAAIGGKLGSKGGGGSDTPPTDYIPSA